MAKRKKLPNHPLKDAFIEMVAKQIGRPLTKFENDTITHILRIKGIAELQVFIDRIIK